MHRLCCRNVKRHGCRELFCNTDNNNTYGEHIQHTDNNNTNAYIEYIQHNDNNTDTMAYV